MLSPFLVSTFPAYHIDEWMDIISIENLRLVTAKGPALKADQEAESYRYQSQLTTQALDELDATKQRIFRNTEKRWTKKSRRSYPEGNFFKYEESAKELILPKKEDARAKSSLVA